MGIRCRKGEASMYAVLRLNSFDPVKLAVAADRLQEFDKIHAAQPGYVGSVVVNLGAGRRFVLNLWETEQHGAAALQVLGPEVGRLLGPLMAAPSQLIGAGTVLSSDLVRAASA
jgi:hypothetical protein